MQSETEDAATSSALRFIYPSLHLALACGQRPERATSITVQINTRDDVRTRASGRKNATYETIRYTHDLVIIRKIGFMPSKKS